MLSKFIVLLAVVLRADPVSGGGRDAPPLLDVTKYGASGSGLSFRAGIIAGNKEVRFETASDFRIGQGIKIEHAGTPCTLNSRTCEAGPLPCVTTEGHAGTTRYVYEIAVLDEHGGIGTAGALGSTAKGAAVLSADGYNLLRWAPIPGAAGYAIYRNGKLLTVVSGRTPEGYYEPPRGPEFTSSFKDFGLPPFATPFPDIPSSPPTMSLADCLVSEVQSVEGAQVVHLKDAPSVNVHSAVASHDDSHALQAAFDAAQTGTRIYFPAGRYRFTQLGFSFAKSITIQGAGEGNTALEDNLVGNSFAKWVPPLACGFLSPTNADAEISQLSLHGLSAFGSSMTRLKKAICATGGYQRLYVHNVTARGISGEAIYAEDNKPGEVVFSRNTVTDSAKNGLNTNSGSLRSVIFTDNTIRNVSGAAILVVSKEAVVSGNHIDGGKLPFGSDVVNVATTGSFTIAANEISNNNLSLAATSLLHIGFFGSGLKGGGLVVANYLHDNITANSLRGGAILIDDVDQPVLVSRNVIDRLQGCCQKETTAISLAHNIGKVLITANTVRFPAQGIGVRTEESVSQENGVVIGPNKIAAGKLQVLRVGLGGKDEGGFEELKKLSEKWPNPPANP